MPRERSAYDILGLPPHATPSQVRTRFRQVVRRYHASRSTEQLFEDDQFLQLVRAYLLLESARRRDYDRMLRSARGRPVPLPDLLAPMSPSDRVLVAAEVALMRREIQGAATLARTVIDSTPREARAWALLGQILLAERKYDEAIPVFNYAIQFDPDNQHYWELLNEATALREGRAPSLPEIEPITGLERPAYHWVALVAAAVVVAFTLVWLRPRIHASWYVYGLEIPVAPLAIGGLDGLLLGAALAAGNWLDRFEDELIGYQVWYETAGGRDQARVPAGLIILPVGLICFWLDVVFYAVMAYMEERLSPSISLAFGLVAAVTVVLTVAAPGAHWMALVLGGNATFAGMMLGWFLGSQRRTVWRRVD